MNEEETDLQVQHHAPLLGHVHAAHRATVPCFGVGEVGGKEG